MSRQTTLATRPETVATRTPGPFPSLVSQRETALRAAFYREHIEVARSYAAYLTRDPYQAEDVATEAVWRALCRINAGKQLEHPRAYVKTTVRNLLTDAARSKASEVVPLEPQVADRLLADERIVEDHSDQVVLRMRVAEALELLAPRHRQALRMLYLDDLSPAEAAEELGITANACAVLAHRARRAFATAWAAKA